MAASHCLEAAIEGSDVYKTIHFLLLYPVFSNG